TRSGTTFTAAYSSDGSSFTTAGTATISMANTVYLGLAVSSLTSIALNTSTFDNVSLTGNVNPAPTYNALAAPANVAVSVGTGTGLNLSWDAVAGATGYAIDRSSDGVSFSQIATTTSLTSYSDNNLPGAQRYFYRVAALDGSPNRSTPSGVAAGVNRPSAVAGL